MNPKNYLEASNAPPQAVLFDIGMTMIFPDGDVIAHEIHRRVPDAGVVGADAARALSIAAEAHHFHLGVEDSDRVGWVIGHLLGLPAAVGIQAWRAACARSDLYSILDPDSVPVLQALRRAGIKTAAVSNALNCVHDELATFGLLSHFDVVIGSSDGYPDKPDPAMFKAALSKLEVQPPEAWYVGDGLINDVLGASRAHIGEQILVDKYGIYAKSPCRTVASMGDLLEVVASL